MRRRAPATVFVVSLLLLLFGATPASAFSSYATFFPTLYPASATQANAGCNLCHSRGGGTDLNPYGEAWAVAHNSGLSETASYQAVEGMNSDNDPTGASNLAEITASAQPGWTPGAVNTLFDVSNPGTGSVIATNVTPPTITGNVLDPPVTPANRPPVLAPIANQSATEGQLLTFGISATDPDGNALTFVGGNLPTGATLLDNHNGTATFSWTPAFNQAGNYSVLVTVSDNGTPIMSASQSFTITVGNVNRPPVLDPIGAQTASVGQLLSFTARATDPDGDALTFTASNLPAGATLVDNLNGTAAFNWTPDVNQTGNFSVTITATDAGTPPQSASETFTITVGSVNRPPVLAAIGNKSVDVGQLLAFTVSATDPDGNSLSFTATGLPAGASFVDNLNGTASFSWTPGASGNFPVTVTVSDNGTPPLTASETFTITVGNVNRPPVLNLIGNQTATEGQPLSIAISATDPDGGPLAFTAEGVPTGVTFTDNGNGTATLLWTPAVGQAGDYPVTVTVTDPGGLTDSESFTITVQAAPTQSGFDVRIRRFVATESVRVGRPVQFSLEVRNTGGVEGEAPATLVGVQNSLEVYRNTITVTAPARSARASRSEERDGDEGRGGRARFTFPEFTPTTTGRIAWTVTVQDDHPDTASETTRVRAAERREGSHD